MKVIYAGIPAFCNKCWKIGHAHWECKEKNKTNWLEFVVDLYLNDDVTEDMLGSWVDAIYKFHPSLGGIPKNGTTAQFVGPHKDLRQHLKSLQTTQSQPTEGSDLRTLLSNLQANKHPPGASTPTSQARQQNQNRGRGRGNDHNRGQGRGKNQGQRGQGRDQANATNNRGRGNTRGGNNRNQLIAGLVQLLNSNK